MFGGALTALVTPMRDGRVDIDGLRALVDFQIENGIDGLVACGTTGETSCLSMDEQSAVISTVVAQAKGRVPVIAGAGCNATSKAIELSKMAAEAGVDALLHVTPYYNKPSREGLKAHFTAVANATPLPVVLYNVPGRTGCDMPPDLVIELAQIDRVVAIKEATGSIVRAQQLIACCADNGVDLDVISGDDATAFSLVTVGGAGVISVVSNIVPRKMADLIRATKENRLEQARSLQYELLPLMDAMFLKSNPIPVKAGVSLLGFSANEVRLPLFPLEGAALEQLKGLMQKADLL